MMKLFGYLPDGSEVCCVSISSGPVSASVINYGAIIKDIVVADRNGDPVDVACGFDNVEAYISQTGHFGGVLGRCGNRIGGASFELNGKTYDLCVNDGPNHLHGGTYGFDRLLWNVEEVGEDTVLLSLHSPDGQENYPGSLDVKVRYTVMEDGLWIDYWAESTEDTLCNLSNHTYFNLAGHCSGEVLDQYIELEADRFTVADAGSIPTGELRSVEGTPMDLRTLTRIGEHINEDYDQLVMPGGYDSNWEIRGEAGKMRKAAEAYCPVTGIDMQVVTDRPGIQFYAGNFMDGGPAGKHGEPYVRRGGFCLETQTFPDAIHHPEFPTAILRKGDEWRSRTGYLFSVRND